MLKEGTVAKIDGDFATILVKTQNACDVCRAECGGHCDKAKLTAIKIENTLGAQVGDRVEVYSKTNTIMLYAILVFILPIVSCFLTVLPVATFLKSPLLLTLVGVATFLLVFTVLHFAFRKKRDNDIFRMQRIIK